MSLQAKRRQAVERSVTNVSDKQLMSEDLEKLARDIASKCSFDLPRLGTPALKSPQNIEIGPEDLPPMAPARFLGLRNFYPGVMGVAEIPLDGDLELLDYLPNEFSTRLPVADINFSTKTISVTSKQPRDSYDPSNLVSLVNFTIGEINEYLERMGRTIAPLNTEIFNLAEQSLYTRRKNLEATIRTSQDQGWQSGFDVSAAAESLVKDSKVGNNFANLTSLPSAGQVEKIREVIHRLAENIESTNRFVRNLDEESLRDALLLSLKSITENRADGEIFRRNGKTDILVSGERDAIFIAECKFWSGEKKYIETINQILENYVTARDRNIAILVFNRNKNALNVFNNLIKATQEYGAYLNTIEESADKRRLDVEFQNPIDKNIKIHCSIVLYDLS